MIETVEEELDEDAKQYPIMKFFKYSHLPEKLQGISKRFARLAVVMAAQPSNAETSAGLRHLLEAKDCAVRAAL